MGYLIGAVGLVAVLFLLKHRRALLQRRPQVSSSRTAIGIAAVGAVVATTHLSIGLTFPTFYGMLWTDPAWWPLWILAHIAVGTTGLLSWARTKGIMPNFSDIGIRVVAGTAGGLILISVTLTVARSGFFSDAVHDTIRYVKTAWTAPEEAHATSPSHDSIDRDRDPYYKKTALVAFNDAWKYENLPDARYTWRADRFPVYVRYDDQKFAVDKENGETVYYRFLPNRPRGQRFVRMHTDKLHIESHTKRIGFRAPGTQPVRVTIGFSRKDLDDFSESERALPATNE